MGEGMGNDEALMASINSANIACGYHAGDPATMEKLIDLCLFHHVHIGAHPSFPDRQNFGRKPMIFPAGEIYTFITQQLNLIDGIAKKCGAILHHVKPHGALYNMAVTDRALASVLAHAVKDFNPSLVYYGLSGSVMIEEAERQGLQTAREVFADRTYQKDGTLTPRSEPNALLHDPGLVVKQVLKFIKENKVTSVSGEEIYIKADTICIHGDGEHALLFAKTIKHEILRLHQD
jgi:UPF0271 protein